MRRIEVATGRAVQAIDVTDMVTGLAWPDGWLALSVPHTTAALILGEADPEMLADYEAVAAGLVAPFEPFRHHRNDNPNASAHIISSLAGTQLLLPVEEGRVLLGTWQRIILVELDGPKSRTILAGGLPALVIEE